MGVSEILVQIDHEIAQLRRARALLASGFAGIYTASGHSGLVLQLDVGINFDLFDIIKIKGTGQIRLNTTPDDHTVNGITIYHLGKTGWSGRSGSVAHWISDQRPDVLIISLSCWSRTWSI